MSERSAQGWSLIEQQLAASGRSRWLVTGCAGFIGSHLIEALLSAGQEVCGLDNFSTGHRHNLDDVRSRVGEAAWSAFTLVEGDIADPAVCEQVCQGGPIVLHQAALGSVPRSLADPITTHRANATGFLNLLWAAQRHGVPRFVYAASSSTYGDSPSLPKVEDIIGRPLSPYAVTKYLNELYADVFGRCYGLQTVGLRYFNVFGPRQDPNGAYAAVIPRWVATMLRHEVCTINGDGETSRDFCYVRNAVQANLLAALSQDPQAVNQVYNVAYGQRTTLKALHAALASQVSAHCSPMVVAEPRFADFRAGDVRHSLADISKAVERLGYLPTHSAAQGIAEAVPWYVQRARQAS
ncbi:MAG: SDR family oxidoreductase [Rubrivivax sp.]|nr:SDR family oxidoreductase [Rubrivivax sp.]